MMLFLVQVFITYGEETKANFRLLRTYGFVTDFNAFEAAVIPVDKHSFTQALEGLPTLQEAVRAMPEVDLARLTLNSEKVQLSKVLAVFRRWVHDGLMYRAAALQVMCAHVNTVWLSV